MTNIDKTLLIAATALVPVAAVAPAQAQVSGVAMADPQQAIQDCNAWKSAAAQIQTTYKAQIDKAEARSKAIQAQLKPMIDSFDAARKTSNPNQQALQQQLQTIQQKRKAGNQEISQMTQPIQRARAYALEQISKQYQAAAQAVISAKNVQLLLGPDQVLYVGQAANITSAITAQLNQRVTSVSITPPAGWQPGQQQQQGQAAVPPPAQPQNPSPSGR